MISAIVGVTVGSPTAVDPPQEFVEIFVVLFDFTFRDSNRGQLLLFMLSMLDEGSIM